MRWRKFHTGEISRRRTKNKNFGGDDMETTSVKKVKKKKK